MPRNTRQLHDLLREVVQCGRTGIIEPEDLPAEAHSVSLRLLSPLESLERDAIVKCLADAHDNKAQAARALGMSRATIYRKDPRLRDHHPRRLTALLTPIEVAIRLTPEGSGAAGNPGQSG